MLENAQTVPPQTGKWVFILCLVTGTTLLLVIGVGMWAVFDAPLPGDTLLEAKMRYVFAEEPHFSFVYMPVLLMNILAAALAAFVGFLVTVLRRDEVRLALFGVGFVVLSVIVTFALLTYSYSI